MFLINGSVSQGSFNSYLLLMIFSGVHLIISIHRSISQPSILQLISQLLPPFASRIVSLLNLFDFILINLDRFLLWGSFNFVELDSLKTQLTQNSLSKTQSHFHIFFEDPLVFPVNNLNIIGLNITKNIRLIICPVLFDSPDSTLGALWWSFF